MSPQLQAHLNVVVVDDPQTAHEVRTLLTGCAVHSVTSPQDLSQRLTRDACPVGLIDPGLDWLADCGGFEAVAALYPETAWILHTAATEASLYIAAINQGRVVRSLPRPCAPEALRAALEEAARVGSSPAATILPESSAAQPAAAILSADLQTALLNQLAEGVLLLDQAGTVRYANRTVERLLGIPVEGMIGCALPDAFNSVIAPDDAQRFAAFFHLFLEEDEPGGTAHFRCETGEVGLAWLRVQVRTVSGMADDLGLYVVLLEDVTAPVWNERILAESEQRFRTVSELTSDYAFSVLVSDQGQVTFEWWTEALPRITGYPPDQILEHWQTLFHPDDLPVALNHFRAFLSGEADQAQFRIVNLHGEIRWVLNNILPQRMEDGDNRIRMICAGRDITSEKLTMQALYESESRLRGLFEASPDSIVMLDLQGNYLLMNEQNARMYGFDSVVDMLAVGSSALDFVAPEQRDQVIELLQRVKSEQKFRGSRVVRLLRRDGTSFAAESNVAVVLSEDGVPNALIAITRDVTDRLAMEDLLRRSQEQYRIVSELTSDYAFSMGIGADGSRYIEWDTGTLDRLFDSPLGQPVAYDEWRTYIVPDDLAALERSFNIVFHGMPTAGEVRTRGTDGEGRVLLFYLMPFWDQSQQQVTRVYGAVRDITVERRAEAANVAQAKALAAIQERQALARDLHDAVSQSLFSASILAEMLIRTLDTRSTDQLRASLTQLHLLTRSAQAEMRTLLLELRPTALEETPLRELVANLALAAETRSGARVRVEIDPRAEEMPVAVKVAFYRIVQEALNNAAKHARASAITVELLSRENQVYLIVRDNGSGFAVDQVAADRMGLRIMRERAELIGATFQLLTSPGEGTALTVSWSA